VFLSLDAARALDQCSAPPVASRAGHFVSGSTPSSLPDRAGLPQGSNMKSASIEIRARRPAPQTFATVTTTSGLQALQAAIGMEERRTTFQIVPIIEKSVVAPSILDKSGGHPRFDLRADTTNIGAAIDTVRSLLGSLMDAADRGMLGDFEITRGVDLLHRIPGRLTYALPQQLRPSESVRLFPD